MATTALSSQTTTETELCLACFGILSQENTQGGFTKLFFSSSYDKIIGYPRPIPTILVLGDIYTHTHVYMYIYISLIVGSHLHMVVAEEEHNHLGPSWGYNRQGGGNPVGCCICWPPPCSIPISIPIPMFIPMPIG